MTVDDIRELQAQAWDEGYRENKPYDSREYRDILNPYRHDDDASAYDGPCWCGNGAGRHTNACSIKRGINGFDANEPSRGAS